MMMTQIQTQKKKTSRRREILKDKELRQEFLAEQIKTGLRFQLRSLRDSQDLTQGKLAELIGTKQSVISRLEKSPERVSLPTLIDIANALDVGVVVRFEQIDSIIDWYDHPTTIKMTPRQSEDVLNAPELEQPDVLASLMPLQAVSKVKRFVVSNKATSPSTLPPNDDFNYFDVISYLGRDGRENQASPYEPVTNVRYDGETQDAWFSKFDFQ